MDINAPARLLRGGQAEYGRAVFTGENGSNYEPFDDSVLILVDICAEKTSGGVILTPQRQMEMSLASETGVIVEMGESCFTLLSDGREWRAAKRPKPGDRVFFERFAGREILGADGKIYRSMTFTCVGGREKAVSKPKRKKAKR